MPYGLQDADDYSRMAELNAMHLEWHPKRKPRKKVEPRMMIPTMCRKCGCLCSSYRSSIDHCRGSHHGRPKGMSGKIRIRQALETAIRNTQVEPCKPEETGL